MHVSSVLSLAVAAGSVQLSSAAAIKATNDSFLNPGRVYRPSVRYWLPDASVSNEILARDIKDLAEVGMGGFHFVPFYLYGLSTPGAVPPVDWNVFGFGSPSFKTLFDTAVDSAHKNDIYMSFALGASQGQGAPAKIESEGLAKELAYSTFTLSAGSSFTSQIPLPPDTAPGEAEVTLFQHARYPPISQKLIAVVAAKIEKVQNTLLGGTPPRYINDTFLDPKTMMTITSKVVNSTLTFTPPSNGTWKIFSFYERFTNQKSTTGGANPTSIIGNGSWIVDHFSSDGARVTTDFFDTNVLDSANMQRLAQIGQYGWEDSQEMYSPVWWTPDFLTQFKARRGYDFDEYLPFIFNGENTWGTISAPYGERTYLGAGSDGGEGANNDYRSTLTELNQRYIAHMEDWTHGLNLQFSNQPAYNLPLDLAAQIPLVDVPETESLSFPSIDKLRYFTGPAHMAQKSIISSETGAITVNTTAFSQTLPKFLGFVHEQLVAGVNAFNMHGAPYSGEYASTTWPSYTPFFYVVEEMHSRAQPAWRHYKSVIDYIARNSRISQTGVARIDVAVLTSSLSYQLITQNLSALENNAYSYEHIGGVNLNLPSAVVENKLLAPDGPAFKALIIDGNAIYSRNLIPKVERYAKDGLPIIFVAKVPQNNSELCQSYNCNSASVMTRYNAIVTKYSKNVKISPSFTTLAETLSQLSVKPRVKFKSNNPYYTMWKTDSNANTDYVYFYNKGAASIAEVVVDFKQKRHPFVADAWTGTYSPLVEFSRQGKSIAMQVKLAAGASTIIAFSQRAILDSQLSPEPSVVNSDANIVGYKCDKNAISAKAIGPATLTLSNGRVVSVNGSIRASSSLTKWNITIEDWHPTANLSSMTTEVTNHTFLNSPLQSWLDYKLVNTSGIGHYSTTFDMTSNNAMLSLGPIQNTVKAFVNDRELPPVNLFDAVIDISSHTKIGTNSLRIEIATTLFNAVKSRGSSIATAGAPAAVANPRLLETVPSVSYGLEGPVVVTPYKIVRIV